MPSFGLFFLLILVHAKFAVTQVVDLGYAQYQGTLDTNQNVTTFVGIRFAAPPAGSLRWKAPQAPAAISGVQQANVAPPQCYQANNGNSSTNPISSLVKRQSSTDEDCLFLSVYVPGILTPTAKLPVVVWIHGGGYISGNEAIYDGANLVNDALGSVIAITIQYRLGVFGFLSGKEVRANGVLNAGLLDQQFALKWVQSYIPRFGGDPAAVTIWGESAGAGSVLQHIVANGGRTHPPLFRAALTSSVFLPSQYYYDHPVPEALFAQVVSGSNCTGSTDIMACLRAVDVNTLETLNENINNAAFFGTYTFVPVVDGTFIRERPSLALQAGRVNGDVLLATTVAFEGAIFVSPTTTANITEYITQLFPFLSRTQVDKAVAHYTGVPSLETSLDQAIAVMGESIFICPTQLVLRTFSGRSWKGEFAIPPAFHADDVVYYFSDSGVTPPYDNLIFIHAFSQSFLSVAKNLDPNIKIDPTNITPFWETWNVGNTEMLFNATDGTNADSLPEVKPFSTDPALLTRCAFWHSVSAETIQ